MGSCASCVIYIKPAATHLGSTCQSFILSLSFMMILSCAGLCVCVRVYMCVTYNTDSRFQVVKLLRKKALLSPPQSLYVFPTVNSSPLQRHETFFFFIIFDILLVHLLTFALFGCVTCNKPRHGKCRRQS